MLRSAFLTLALLAAAAHPALARPQAPAPVPASPALGTSIDIGPAVGAHIPPFAAVDSTGAARDFKSLPGRKGVVLVFFRSARWCPFCQRQLIDIKALQGPLAERGYALAAISYDKPAELSTFAEKQGVTYTLLADEGSKMIDAWRLHDPQYPVGTFAYGVPKPAIFVLSPAGVVKAKLALEGYRVRPGNDDVLKAVDGVR